MIVFFKKYTKDDQEKKRKEINQDYWQNYNILVNTKITHTSGCLKPSWENFSNLVF